MSLKNMLIRYIVGSDYELDDSFGKNKETHFNQVERCYTDDNLHYYNRSFLRWQKVVAKDKKSSLMYF